MTAKRAAATVQHYPDPKGGFEPIVSRRVVSVLNEARRTGKKLSNRAVAKLAKASPSTVRLVLKKLQAVAEAEQASRAAKAARRAERLAATKPQDPPCAP